MADRSIAPKLASLHQRLSEALSSREEDNIEERERDMQVIVRGSVPVPGPEDIVVDHAAAVAFSASQQRNSATGKLLGPADMPGGAIFALDLASELLTKRLLIDQEALGFPFH